MTAQGTHPASQAPSPVALLVGGRGFIGSRMVPQLIELGYRIVCVEPVASTLGRLTPYADHVTLVKGTAADREALNALVAEVQPACVVNLAYVRGVDIATEMDIMCRGLWNTFDAARLAGCRRVVFASSVRVYGPQSVHGPDTVLNESSPCHPATRYGHAKLLGERLAADFNAAHGMEIAALRVPMVYGPGVREGAFGVCVPAIAAATGHPTELPYDPAARLCLAHVDEVARALVRLADARAAAPRHALYELGGINLSYAGMVEIARALEPSVRIGFRQTTDHPEYLFAHLLDGSRLQEEHGIQHRTVMEGYREIITHERARQQDVSNRRE